MQGNDKKYLIAGTFGVLLFGFLFRKFRKMDKLTKNFTIDEFQSHDGAAMPEQVKKNVQELAKNLQVIRDYVGKPIKINSGYRSPAQNTKVGGKSQSKHMLGQAADFTIPGLTTSQVLAIVEKLIAEKKIKQGGVGYYPTWIHYDIRGTKARWNG
jgi:uncharacterized protein YcbK (DUF882 family)